TNEDARSTLMKLSEMLRYQLYECNSESISIDKEVKYLNNYVELQKIRLGSNYSISLSVGNEVKNFNLAPLLILPLVENAFKHISHFSDNMNIINIELSLNGNMFTCNVINTVEASKENLNREEGGIGLKNLERRLELL